MFGTLQSNKYLIANIGLHMKSCSLINNMLMLLKWDLMCTYFEEHLYQGVHKRIVGLGDWV